MVNFSLPRRYSMNIKRREFMTGLAALTTVAATPEPSTSVAASGRSYKYLGRVNGYVEHRIIEPGRTVEKIETFTRGPVGVVRITTNDGKEGPGRSRPLSQISPPPSCIDIWPAR